MLEPSELLWISAESLVRGGYLLADEPDAPELYAAALADLVTRAPAPEQVPELVPRGCERAPSHSLSVTPTGGRKPAMD
jgi:hypothetical protein